MRYEYFRSRCVYTTQRNYLQFSLLHISANYTGCLKVLPQWDETIIMNNQIVLRLLRNNNVNYFIIASQFQFMCCIIENCNDLRFLNNGCAKFKISALYTSFALIVA